MKKVAWREAQELAEFRKIVPGGYIARIVSVEDEPTKEYLKIEYDISEGPLKGIYAEQYEKFKNWNGRFFRSYKEKALGFFKNFIVTVEKSNQGYIFNDDEKTLVGKYIGVILGMEEYTKITGEIGVRIYVANVVTPECIRKGEFKVPGFKKLKEEEISFTEAAEYDDDDLPF